MMLAGATVPMTTMLGTLAIEHLPTQVLCNIKQTSNICNIKQISNKHYPNISVSSSPRLLLHFPALAFKKKKSTQHHDVITLHVFMQSG